MMSTFVILASVWLFSNFDEKVNMGQEVKGELLRGLNELPIHISHLLVIVVIFYALNIFFVTSQMFWHKLLDASWCNNNYYNRERATKNQTVAD